MSKILAIDYGLKRCGLAETDPMGLMAFSKDTIDTPRLKSYLKTYLVDESIRQIVIGLPLTLNAQMNPIENNILDFIQWLNGHFPYISIERLDERFTSKMASRVILESGINKKSRRDKSLVDRVSATILLQQFLQMHIP